MSLLSSILEKKKTGQKSLAVLIDPDRVESPDHLLDLLAVINESEADLLFYGGSLITESKDFDSLGMIKKASDLPVVLFPSSPSQIRKEADAILFLSLISGRNPEFLIGHHVTAAPILKASNLEILPVGYMLVGGSRQTTAGYISNTSPIPPNKPEIAAATAMAGEMLGMRLLYLDAGSGADVPVSTEMIEAVKTHTDTPLIVGGGIRSVDTAARAYRAGADIIVVGTAIEEEPDLLGELSGIKSLKL